MFLLKKLWNTFDAVSLLDQIYQLMSTDFFGNLMGLFNIITVVGLFIIARNMFRNQAQLSTKIQLDEQEAREEWKTAKELCYNYFTEHIIPQLDSLTIELFVIKSEDYLTNIMTNKALFNPFETYADSFSSFVEINGKLSLREKMTSISQKTISDLRTVKSLGRQLFNAEGEHKSNLLNRLFMHISGLHYRINEILE